MAELLSPTHAFDLVPRAVQRRRALVVRRTRTLEFAVDPAAFEDGWVED